MEPAYDKKLFLGEKVLREKLLYQNIFISSYKTMQYHVLQTNAVVTKCLSVTKGYRYLNKPTAKTCMFAEVCMTFCYP